jgi:hypothetical protein
MATAGGTRPKYAGTVDSLPASYTGPIFKLGDALGLSHDAALAVALAQEVLRDYCPVEERGKVIAALFGLENRRRTEGNVP